MKYILHFIFPILLLLYFELPYNKDTIHRQDIVTLVKFSVIIFILVYFIKMAVVYYRKFYTNKNKVIIDKYFASIKKWLNFLFIIISLIFLRLLIVLVYEIYNGIHFLGNTTSFIQSILLFIIFFKVLISPEILYGYPKLVKQLATFNEEKKDIFIWKSITCTITNVQESKLLTQIISKVNSYILAIDTFVDNENPFRDPNYSINDLSNEMNIPSSHLSFIFKHHCKFSFVEYKNYSKIKDAINLINENFLDSKTLDSLAYKVGFKSYNSFFIYFKKQTNYSPKEYLLYMQNKLKV